MRSTRSALGSASAAQVPDDLPNPALMLEARDAAYAELYALDRQRLSDADWATFEPMAFRLLNSHARAIVLRFVLTEKG